MVTVMLHKCVTGQNVCFTAGKEDSIPQTGLGNWLLRFSSWQKRQFVQYFRFVRHPTTRAWGGNELSNGSHQSVMISNILLHDDNTHEQQEWLTVHVLHLSWKMLGYFFSILWCNEHPKRKLVKKNPLAQHQENKTTKHACKNGKDKKMNGNCLSINRHEETHVYNTKNVMITTTKNYL